MATVIGVRFKKAGKVYYFDPDGIWPRPGDYVIVETARGVEFGEVVTGSRSVNDAQIVAPLKKVIRVASEEDIQRAEYNEKRETEAFRICQERIAKHKLDMKLVSVEYTFDNNKIIFYFTANGRVDFRDLVKDLASVFKIRIELRQIGVRDEAKMLGGLGSCGRPICCGAFLGDFQPVSIKMAKEQNLSLNPTKISGQCGRLMCCLKYEQENYEQVLKRVPRVGKDIVTPDGVGVITEINCIKESIKVRIRVDDDSFDVREYPIDDVRRPGPEDAAAIREQRPEKPLRRGRPQPAEGASDADGNDTPEDGARKRYPHQKAPKNLSTDQFLEKMKEDDGTAPTPAKEHRRKRNRGGKAGEERREAASEAPNTPAEATKVQAGSPKNLTEASKVSTEGPKAVEEAPKAPAETSVVPTKVPKAAEEAPKTKAESPRTSIEIPSDTAVTPKVQPEALTAPTEAAKAPTAEPVSPEES